MDTLKKHYKKYNVQVMFLKNLFFNGSYRI